MALNPLVFDTYKRYKAGTAKLVSFLANTARKTKLVDDLFVAVLPKKGNGRLKGKARSAKRQVQKTQTYQIRTADFVRMAEAILASKNVKVPDSLIRTLEDVIAARKECAGWFSSQQNTIDESTQSSNEKHRHFIQILQKVQQILTQQTAASGKQKQVSEKLDRPDSLKQVEDLGNLFEYLEVEDPAEWTSGSLPSNSSKIKTTVSTYELEPSDEDLSFAIFCFLKDLTEIRHYVRQTWAEYREKQIAFTTAAVTMNTAIALFRRLNDDFVSDFPKFDEHRKIIEYIYNGYCDPQNGTGDNFATYAGSGFRLSSRAFFCDHTWEVLDNFIDGGRLPFYRSNTGLPNTDDEVALLKCLSLLSMVGQHFVDAEVELFPEDQLIKGISLVQKDKQIYTWVVFAVQLLVDTRRVVGKELDRCLQEFHKLQEWISATIKQFLQFGKTNKVNNHYVLCSEGFKRLSALVDLLCREDIVQKNLEEYFGDRVAEYSWGPFFLYRNHPMLAGLLIQRFLTELHEHGVGLAGDQGCVMTAIHLYNTSHQSGRMPKSKEWTDLEKLIGWEGSQWIFFGDRPETPDECFSRYIFVMGVSTVAAARDRRGKLMHDFEARGVPQAQRKNRKFRLMSRYAELGCSGWNAGKIGGPRYTPTRARGDPIVMLEMLTAKTLEEKLDGTKISPYKARKLSKQAKLAPLAMLSTLKECFKAEELVFRFDFLTLNQRCVELLRRIQKVCLEQSPLDYPNVEYAGDQQVNNCFMHMVAGEFGVERNQPTRFEEACLLLQEVVEAEGAAEFDRAKTRCFTESDDAKKVTDDFKTPDEDNILLSERIMSMFGGAIIDDGEEGVTFTAS